MGAKAQILLVIKSCFISCILFFPLSGKAENLVDAARYNAFWLWAAVRPQPVLNQAKMLYLHQGEIAGNSHHVRFLRQGIPVSRINAPAMWVSVRVTTLEIPDRLLQSVLQLCDTWKQQGNYVVGIQIDFDAGSYQLQRYGAFLHRVRHHLGAEYQLSVTGLLDWAKTGSVDQLNRLPVDEVVIQTYQGRTTVKNYHAYLPALLKLTIPFRIGLVQQGEWDPTWQITLSGSKYYRGEVIFLVNKK